MTSVEERLKLKRGQVDPWSTREKLCLASSVVRSGNQNWMSVSRSLRGFGGEPGRPADWFSQKSCAVQYDNLLTQIETPKRKKRGADGSKSEGPDLTPAEVIVKQLTSERIEELRKMMAEARAVYMREKEELYLVENGLADDRLDEILYQIQEEKRQKELKQEEHQRWLKEREERKQEKEMAWRPHAAQQHYRGAGAQAARRPSNQSELGSEAENMESPSSSEQPLVPEDASEPKPIPTPTSPLLTGLLKSPSPVTSAQQSSSILHSAITSQRGASPTITSLLNSSPGLPSATSSLPLSPNLKSLVSNALAGHDDVPKSPSHSASSAPTLSMLLGLPPSTPGKLPELPYSATKAPTSTPSPSTAIKTGGVLEDPEVEHLPELEVSKVLETTFPPVHLESETEVIAVSSQDYTQETFESYTASELFSSDMSPQVTSIELPQQGDFILETPSGQDNACKLVFTAKHEVNSANIVDALKKEPVADVENMEVELPLDTDNKLLEVESKDMLETTELQQMSTGDLGLVMDPSIDVVLEGFSEGMVGDEVYTVFSQDGEASVGSILEAAEHDGGQLPEQVAGSLDNELETLNVAIPVQETSENKEESEATLVVVHTPLAHQSPQQVGSAAGPSTISSPRSVGRPSNSSSISRKIVLEDEKLSLSNTESLVEEGENLEKVEATLSCEDLEKLDVHLLQDNGEVLKLSESSHGTGMIDNIVLQDTSNISVVVVPHETVIKNKESDSAVMLQSPKEETSACELITSKLANISPRKDGQVNTKHSVKSPRKISDDKRENIIVSSPIKQIDEFVDVENTPLEAIVIGSQADHAEPSLQKDRDQAGAVVENEKGRSQPDSLDQEKDKKPDTPLSPRKYKSLSLSRKDKSPAVCESLSKVVSKGAQNKGNDLKKDAEQTEEVKISSRDISDSMQVDEKDVQLKEFKVHAPQIKEEKIVRAETPSTEDDNTRDTDQPPSSKGRRGRHARESTTNLDSVPNSPAPSNIADDKDHRAWKKSIMLVYNRIAAHKNASLFGKPITDDIAPGYSSMVYRPLDLLTIKKNLENGNIRSTEEFMRDILIMFTNAIMYNKSKSPIHEMAREMQEEAIAHLKEYEETQKFVKGSGLDGSHAPSRRGIRAVEKKDPDSEGFVTRRSLIDKNNSAKAGMLGKRKRSLPDDRSTPKRRKDDD